jgi:hypothetical protein
MLLVDGALSLLKTILPDWNQLEPPLKKHYKTQLQKNKNERKADKTKIPAKIQERISQNFTFNKK